MFYDFFRRRFHIQRRLFAYRIAAEQIAVHRFMHTAFRFFQPSAEAPAFEIDRKLRPFRRSAAQAFKAV